MIPQASEGRLNDECQVAIPLPTTVAAARRVSALDAVHIATENEMVMVMAMVIGMEMRLRMAMDEDWDGDGDLR